MNNYGDRFHDIEKTFQERLARQARKAEDLMLWAALRASAGPSVHLQAGRWESTLKSIKDHLAHVNPWKRWDLFMPMECFRVMACDLPGGMLMADVAGNLFIGNLFFHGMADIGGSELIATTAGNARVEVARMIGKKNLKVDNPNELILFRLTR